MAKVRLTDETTVQVVRMVAIALLVIAGLVALSLQPGNSDGVIPVVSVGVSAIASVRRAEPQQQLVAASVTRS